MTESTNMIENRLLLAQLNHLLTPEKYQDYCPNGLQVEGSSQIDRIITGVSLTEKLIDKAITYGANAIIVHHGIFWHKDDSTITGIKHRRLSKLIKHGINLYAYHLPLDNHQELGNNVQLASKLDLVISGQTEQQGLLWFGELSKPRILIDLVSEVELKLQHKSLYFGQSSARLMRKIAWCTGSADSLFNAAIKLDVDVYITGEVSEPIMSMAEESGVAYIAAGHYATERYGIQALTEYLKHSLNIPVEYIELYNPV